MSFFLKSNFLLDLEYIKIMNDIKPMYMQLNIV